MSIDKEEIQKYIFDPDNPKQCKSYELLLRTAKREHYMFLSPNFMQQFFADEILDEEFKKDIWDLPDNYNELSSLEKINLYIEELSSSDLKEFVQNKIDKMSLSKITKYSFMDTFSKILTYNAGFTNAFSIIENIDKSFFKKYMTSVFYKNDNNFCDSGPFNKTNYDKHFIFLTKNYFNILETNILKSSVLITLEENIDKFLEYDSENVKPLFLKKIQDIDLLFNILNNDINGNKSNSQVTSIPMLDRIGIYKFYSLKKIELDNLENKKEIYIVGENGDGKTLLLQSIALGLRGVVVGKVFDLVNSQKNYKTNITFSDKTRLTKQDLEENKKSYPNLLAYGANRNHSCGNKEDELGFLTLFSNDIDLHNPNEWLIYLDHKKAKGEDLIISVDEAKELLNKLLGKDIEIIITVDDVTFKEKGSLVTFNQLSAGYRGVIIIICDMIKRFSKTQSCENISEFQGVVLIDEVELHLHPKWKYNFIKKLRDIFPLVQFIVTTHSPTVILGANKEAVFYKVFKKDGEVKISEQIPNSGFTTNSIISSPLFDLDTIASRDLDVEKINDDDYIYSKIHQIIAEKIKNNNIFDDKEISKMIEEELDKI